MKIAWPVKMETCLSGGEEKAFRTKKEERGGPYCSTQIGIVLIQ